MMINLLMPFVRSIAVLTALFLVGLVGCKKKEEQVESGDKPLKVKVTRVDTGTLVRNLGFVGDIEGRSEVSVFSPVPDRVISLFAKEGQTVKAGDVLAVIRYSSLSEGVRQAAGGLDAIRAQRVALQDQLNRMKVLQGSGAVTNSQLLNVESQLSAADAQVRQLEATLGQARQRRGDALIRSPIAGVVGQVTVEVGDLAAPQIPICTVVDMDEVKVRVQVPEHDLLDIRQGQPAEVRVAASNGDPIRGAVSRVGPVLDRLSRTAVMEIDLDNKGHLLKPGMLARVLVEVERKEGALRVPKDAVTVTAERKGETSLYRAVVVEGQKAVERVVTIGLEDGVMAEVIDGLKAGDVLVIEGQHMLADGDPVEISADGEADRTPQSDQAVKPSVPETKPPAVTATTGG